MIDYEVQNIADSFRGNPQGLMQRYQQSQQLIDLLALQKIKKEKEEAARQLMLSQQNVPGTILEQREKEVLDMTKQELQGQVGGTLNNMAQQQSSEGRQPNLYGGVASMAPPMGGFAEGGIVGFAEGGDVEGDDLNWFERAVAGLGEYGRESARRSGELKALEAKRMRDNNLRFKQMFENLGRVYRGEPKLTEGEKAAMALRGPNKMSPDVKLDELPQPKGIEAVAPPSAEPSDSDSGVGADGGVASLLGGDPRLNELRNKQLERMLKRNPAAERKTEEGRLSDMMSDPELEAERRAAIKRRKEQRGEMLDPEKLRRERLISALLGAGGATSFGSAMKGAGLASQNARRQQEIASGNWSDEDLRTTDALLKEAQGIGEKAYNAGVNAESRTDEAISQAMRTMSEMDANRVQAAMENTQRDTLEFQKNMMLLGANQEEVAKINQRISEEVSMMGGMAIEQAMVKALKDGDMEKFDTYKKQLDAMTMLFRKKYLTDLQDYTGTSNMIRKKLGAPMLSMPGVDTEDASVMQVLNNGR